MFSHQAHRARIEGGEGMAQSIKELRSRSGLSQASFAREFGIPVRSLQQWEQGRSTPPDYVAELVSRVLFAEGAATAEPDTAPALRFNPRDYLIEPRSTWKVCLDRPFRNCERIYPLQQRKMRALLDVLDGKPGIGRVIVFGSSVTERCHVGSDVDVFVETQNPDELFALVAELDFEYDVWTPSAVDERLMAEITRTGVMVNG